MGKPEETLIEAFRCRFPNFSLGLGIGDDAALLDAVGTLALTNDMLIDGVDFTSSIPIEFVARKSLSVNLSDLAAMGARPVAFLLAVAFSRDFIPQMTRFADALALYAQRMRIELIGGDLSSAEKLTISITAIGNLEERGALLRSGARVGDRIYLSRPIGASAAGLELLQAGWGVTVDGAVQPPPGLERAVGYAQRELAQAVIRHHVAPEPEIDLGIKLSALGTVSSCIDVSDGLSSDLRHLCIASRKGAIIEWERIPAFPDLLKLGPTLRINVERTVLHGGEDYALLFTSSLREAELSTQLGRPVYAIGRMVEDTEMLLQRNGKTQPLTDEGFDHFR